MERGGADILDEAADVAIEKMVREQFEERASSQRNACVGWTRLIARATVIS